MSSAKNAPAADNPLQHLFATTLTRKLGAISALFALPVVLLTLMFLAQSQKDVNFAKKEIAGAEYLNYFWPAFSVVLRSEPLIGEVDATLVSDLQKTANLHDPAMGTKPAMAAFLGSLKSGTEKHYSISSAQRAFQSIGDGSNLILDPDLDSYYAMSAVVNDLPQVAIYTSKTVDLLTSIARDPLTISNGAANLSAHLAVLSVAASNLEASLQSAIDANADGSLKLALQDLMRANAANAKSLQVEIRSLQRDLAKAATGDGLNTDSLNRLWTVHLKSMDALWTASNTELRKLLERRIAGLNSSASQKLISVGGICLLAAVLMFAVSRSIQRPVRDLIEAMAKLRDGNADFVTPHTALANEFGDIARSLELSRTSAKELAQARIVQDQQRREALDRAAEMHTITTELNQLIGLARKGDFDHRLPENASDNTLRDLARGMNELTASVDEIFKQTMQSVSALARGDLSQEIRGAYAGNFGRLKDDVNAMIERVRTVTGNISFATESVQTAAAEIQSGVADLSARTEQQATALEETSASMEEMAASIHLNARNAKDASEEATAARDLAQQGGRIAVDAVAAMERITQSSKQINEVVTLIEEISFQTNILALNAAVEAARAGEAGRGFAVVASEVRALSQRSSASLKEVKSLIAIAGSNVETGAMLVTQAGSALTKISDAAEKVATAIVEISSASQEQAANVDQVSRAISQMDEVTQQNSALVEEINAALQSTTTQIEELHASAQFFKMDGKTILRNKMQPHAGAELLKQVALRQQNIATRDASAQTGIRQRVVNSDWEEF